MKLLLQILVAEDLLMFDEALTTLRDVGGACVVAAVPFLQCEPVKQVSSLLNPARCLCLRDLRGLQEAV